MLNANIMKKILDERKKYNRRNEALADKVLPFRVSSLESPEYELKLIEGSYIYDIVRNQLIFSNYMNDNQKLNEILPKIIARSIQFSEPLDSRYFFYNIDSKNENIDTNFLPNFDFDVMHFLRDIADLAYNNKDVCNIKSLLLFASYSIITIGSEIKNESIDIKLNDIKSNIMLRLFKDKLGFIGINKEVLLNDLVDNEKTKVIYNDAIDELINLGLIDFNSDDNTICLRKKIMTSNIKYNSSKVLKKNKSK